MKETIAKINEVMAVLQAELAKAAEGNKSAAAAQSNTRTRETRKRVPQTVYRRAKVVRQDANMTVPARPSSCENLYFILTKYSATPPMDDRTSSSDR